MVSGSRSLLSSGRKAQEQIIGIQSMCLVIAEHIIMLGLQRGLGELFLLRGFGA